MAAAGDKPAATKPSAAASKDPAGDVKQGDPK